MSEQIKLDYTHGWACDFDLKTGLSKTARSTKRMLSQMKGMYCDEAAYEQALAQQDVVVYEFYEMDAPFAFGHLACGTSITYPGTVGDEFFMTKGHFHDPIDTGEVYYCLSGKGVMLLENPEGDVRVFEFAPGQAVYVPPYYAHRSINTGSEPLVSFFTFQADAAHDYGTIETKGYRKLVLRAPDGGYQVVDNPKWTAPD